MFGKRTLKNIFPGHEDDWYEEVSRHGVLRSLREGELVLQPGAKTDHAILVIKGVLKVYECSNNGTEYFLYFLEPGQACSFSLKTPKDREKRALLIRSASDAQILLIPTHKTKEWMCRFDAWNQFVNNTFSDRFHDMLGTFDTIAFQQLEERILLYLEKQASVTGNEIKLTHADIASDLNSSREVISRLLTKLQAKGKIAKHRHALDWLPEKKKLQKV